MFTRQTFPQQDDAEDLQTKWLEIYFERALKKRPGIWTQSVQGTTGATDPLLKSSPSEEA